MKTKFFSATTFHDFILVAITTPVTPKPIFSFPSIDISMDQEEPDIGQKIELFGEIHDLDELENDEFDSDEFQEITTKATTTTTKKPPKPETKKTTIRPRKVTSKPLKNPLVEPNKQPNSIVDHW